MIGRKIAASLVLAAALFGLFQIGHTELITVRQKFGGPQSESLGGIAVDGTNLYVVGETRSYDGVDNSNFFLSVFRLSDNAHRCSSAIDIKYENGIGSIDTARKVIVHGDHVYIVGMTGLGPVPSNIFIAKMTKLCNLILLKVYGLSSAADVRGMTISGDGSTLFIAGATGNGALLMAVRTSNLSLVWSREFKLTGAGDIANSIAFDGGRLFVTGETSSGDIFVARFKQDGSFELAKIFSTQFPEWGSDIVISSQMVYLTGTYTSSNGQRMFLMRLDTVNFNPNWAIVVDVQQPGETNGKALSMTSGIIYAFGSAKLFETAEDGLMIAFKAATTDLMFTFLLAGQGTQTIIDSEYSGLCVVFGGDTEGWPIFYAVLDFVTIAPISFSISSITPSISTISADEVSTSVGLIPFTPSINDPSSGQIDAFYSRFCPDSLVIPTTTTTTLTTTISTTTTSTRTVETTVSTTTTIPSTTTSTVTVHTTTTSTVPTTVTTTLTSTTTIPTYLTTTTTSVTISYSTTVTMTTSTTSVINVTRTTTTTQTAVTTRTVTVETTSIIPTTSTTSTTITATVIQTERTTQTDTTTSTITLPVFLTQTITIPVTQTLQTIQTMTTTQFIQYVYTYTTTQVFTEPIAYITPLLLAALAVLVALLLVRRRRERVPEEEDIF